MSIIYIFIIIIVIYKVIYIKTVTYTNILIKWVIRRILIENIKNNNNIKDNRKNIKNKMKKKNKKIYYK